MNFTKEDLDNFKPNEEICDPVNIKASQGIIRGTQLFNFCVNTSVRIASLDLIVGIEGTACVAMEVGIEIGYELGKRDALREMLEGK